jgi:hypothetical protein
MDFFIKWSMLMSRIPWGLFEIIKLSISPKLSYNRNNES